MLSEFRKHAGSRDQTIVMSGLLIEKTIERELCALKSARLKQHLPTRQIDDLQRRLRDLPKGKNYVAYCRGPYCVYADRAVDILRANGRHARRLREGFPEWRAAGLPVAVSAAGI